MFLLCCRAKPLHRLFRYVRADDITHTQTELRLSIPLLCGRAIPLHCLHNIFLHAVAISIAHAQKILSPRIALNRSPLPQLKSSTMVYRYTTQSFIIINPQIMQGSGMVLLRREMIPPGGL